MRIMQKKLTFGVIVATRGFFNGELAVAVRRDLLGLLDEQGYGAVIVDEEATPRGAIETRAQARLCADLFKAHQDEIDGIIVALPNFGDELGVVQALDMAGLGVPVLVQACDDELDKLDVAHRRDAFCGKLSVCNNLYQYGIPFTNTSTHTCAVHSDAFCEDLSYFASVCRTVRGLSHARIGAIGARPAPFQTVRYSEKLLQASGITVVPVDLSEIIGAANALSDQEPVVVRKLDEIRSYGRIAASIRADSALYSTTFQSTSRRAWAALTKRPMPAEGSSATSFPSSPRRLGSSGSSTRTTSAVTLLGV